MKRLWTIVGVVLIVLVLAGGALSSWSARPAGTSPPSQARLREFTRLMPIAFRPAIAKQERHAPKLTPRPVPLAIGLVGGQKVRLAFAPALRGGHYDTSAAIVDQGVYSAPNVPWGHVLESVSYFYTDQRRRLPFMVSGNGGPARLLEGRAHDEWLADGASTGRDLGPLTTKGTAGALGLPGGPGDVGIISQSGPAPRLIAIAPAELPPATPAEPGGYALLFDTATLWRQRESTAKIESTHGVGWWPASWKIGRKTTSGQERKYRVSALAHVYVRDGGRWRYARTWALQGSGTAWFTDDERELARVLRGPGGGPPAFGVPDVLLASQIEEYRP